MSTDVSTAPELVVDVRHEGDSNDNALLILNNLAGIAKVFALRVSIHALRFSSPVFNDMIVKHNASLSYPGQEICISLPYDDGDTMFLLCTALHLRNSALPHRLSPEQLRKFALTAAKYKCAVAAGRATTLWFDHIYNTSTPPPPLISMIEAAYLLDDAIFFSRFTERWALSSAHDDGESVWSPQEPRPIGDIPGTCLSDALELLTPELLYCRFKDVFLVRDDIDFLLDICARCLAEDNKHDIDIPPDDGRSEEFLEGETRVPCVVDREGAHAYLAALADAGLWPPARWPATLEEVVRAFNEFRAPDYDDADKCCFCEDVVARFTAALERVRVLQSERMWGLCLDCVKGAEGRVGGCRVGHGKPKADGPPLSLVTANLNRGKGLVTPVTPTVSGN